MAINLNHATNSSVNYHWERKQACTFRKAVHEKTPRLLLTEDDTFYLLSQKVVGRKDEKKKKNS